MLKTPSTPSGVSKRNVLGTSREFRTRSYRRAKIMTALADAASIDRHTCIIDFGVSVRAVTRRQVSKKIEQPSVHLDKLPFLWLSYFFFICPPFLTPSRLSALETIGRVRDGARWRTAASSVFAIDQTVVSLSYLNVKCLFSDKQELCRDQMFQGRSRECQRWTCVGCLAARMSFQCCSSSEPELFNPKLSQPIISLPFLPIPPLRRLYTDKNSVTSPSWNRAT